MISFPQARSLGYRTEIVVERSADTVSVLMNVYNKDGTPKYTSTAVLSAEDANDLKEKLQAP